MARRRQKRTSRAEQRKWLERWGSSGLTARAFAKRHGLSTWCLYAWRRREQEESAEKVGFAEVRVTGKRSAGGVVAIELRNGVRVTLEGAVDTEQLPAVLRAASAC